MSSPPSKQPRKLSSRISLAAKLLLTGAAFWLAFKDVNWDDLRSMLAQENVSYIALAAMCVMAQITLGALRWRYILAALSDSGKSVMSLLDTLKIYYISIFFSNCLPGTIGGDVVRIWITRSEHIPLSLTVNSIIIDRLLALTGLVVVLLIMLPVLSSIIGFDPWLALLAFLALAIIGCWLIVVVDRGLERFEHYRIIKLIRYFFNCMRLLIENPTMSLYSLVFASLSHVFYGLCAFMLANAMGVDIPLIDCVALMPLVMLAITMPISIAGWGVREAVMVHLFTLIGISSTVSILISLQLGLLNILISLPAALLWLTFKNRQQIVQMMDDAA